MATGEKGEEYRRCCPHWDRIFGMFTENGYTHVHFRGGDSRQYPGGKWAEGTTQFLRRVSRVARLGWVDRQ